MSSLVRTVAALTALALLGLLSGCATGSIGTNGARLAAPEQITAEAQATQEIDAARTAWLGAPERAQTSAIRPATASR